MGTMIDKWWDRGESRDADIHVSTWFTKKAAPRGSWGEDNLTTNSAGSSGYPNGKLRPELNPCLIPEEKQVNPMWSVDYS